MPAKYYHKANRYGDQEINGGRMNMNGSKKLTIHTTETSPSAFYRNKVYYHIQLRQDPKTNLVHWEQYIPFDKASRALRHPTGTPETNRCGDVHVNLAIVGYAKYVPTYGNQLYQELAEFMVWLEDEWGVPAEFVVPFGGGEGYGEDGAYRVPYDQWQALSGALSHAAAPFNTHWDPGRLRTDIVTAYIEKLQKPTIPPTPPIGGINNMDAETLTANTTPAEIHQLSEANLFDGDPDFWVARLDQPDLPEWERFWTAVYINSLVR